MKRVLPAPSSGSARIEVGALLTSILLIAVCGLLYELIIGTLATYLQGDSVYQFSITIGVFVSAMGLGAFLSRVLTRNLLQVFLLVEIAIGLIGGFVASGLFAAFVLWGRSFMFILIAVEVLLGALIGLEIPLLTRIAREYGTLRETLSNVLAFDYLGALVASLLFPLILLPYLGLYRTCFLVGLFNLLVVGINLRVLGQYIPAQRGIAAGTIAAGVLLAIGFVQSTAITALTEDTLYQDPILYAEQSRYQRLVVTSYQDEIRLYLDKELQFSSRDEYRYHESLIHPAMSLAVSRENVLVVGGGDGLAVRELLKYPDLGHVTLVDIDPAVTHLGETFGPILQLNGDSLHDPRVTVVNADGYRYLADRGDLYQVIVVDLTDPRNENAARLYSLDFYREVKRHLAPGGTFVTQASSPYFVRKAYWCIVHTMQAAGLQVQPYHAYIPSFGDWGFVVASSPGLDWNRVQVRVPTLFVTQSLLAKMTLFDPDTAEVETDVSTLQSPAVLRYYLEGWQHWRG
ncbi:MAG: polyamine aminopropyltransferase [Anaerolineae bacterium]